MPLARLSIERARSTRLPMAVTAVLHIVVDTFQHMMTGGTDRDEVLAFFLGRVESTDGRKLCGDLIAA